MPVGLTPGSGIPRPLPSLMFGIRWEPGLAIGVSIVDEQHQELFRRVNALIDATREARATAEVRRLFDYLARYVVEHFSDEEQLMREAAFPERETHGREHAEFVRDFQALRADFLEKGAGPPLAVRLNVWLCGWLRRHISERDRSFGAWLESRKPR
jgi:hemerythrin